MRKKCFLLGFFFVSFNLYTLVGCSSEEQVSHETTQTAKTIEMENFRNALKAWVKFKTLNKENSKQLEIIEKTNALLSNEAKAFLISEGISIVAFENKSNENDKEIIALALKMYAEKTKVTTK